MAVVKGSFLAGTTMIRVRRQGEGARFRPGELLVARQERGGQEDWETVGRVDEVRACVWLWRKVEADQPLRAAILEVLRDQPQAGAGYARATGRCWKCRLPLTDAESVERSMGPDCYAKYGG